MVESQTKDHFNHIAGTWERKSWVNSTNLNRRIARFIRETEERARLDVRRHKSSLYFGIGTGILFKYLNRYNLAGVDEAANMLMRCPEGVIQILSKVEELPFLMDNQFHLTFSRNLLKHCPEPERAIESMYRKTRVGGVAVAAESVVLTDEDRSIPTTLVRMTDPSHPPFRTVDELISRFERAGFSRVEYVVHTHRSSWLKRWVEAEQADCSTHESILDLYRTAPAAFKDRHRVVIRGGEVTSSVPWLLVRAYK